MNNYNILLRFIRNTLIHSIHKEGDNFAEIQCVEARPRPDGIDLVVADHLEEIYGNHKNPTDKMIELDPLRKNIMNHFEKVCRKWPLSFCGNFKN